MHRRVSSDDRTGAVNRLAGIAGSLVRAATMAYGDGSRAACRPRAASATWQALVRRLESARPCRARIAVPDPGGGCFVQHQQRGAAR